EFKNRRKAAFIEGIEPLTARTHAIAEAVQFSREVDFGSGEEYVIHELKKIDDWRGEAVRDALAKAPDPDKAQGGVIRNAKEGVHGDVRSDIAFRTRSDDRKEEPEVDPREALRPLKVGAQLTTLAGARRLTLGNGMRVVLLPVDAMPLVAAALRFD